MGIQKPDGTLTEFSVNSKPLFHSNPTRPNPARTSVVDTPSKPVEAQLNEREDRFRASFEQATVGIKHVSTDGKVIQVNPKFCQIVGYTREQVLTRTWQDLTHPDDWASDRAIMELLLAGTLDCHCQQKRYRHQDGSIVWVQITLSLVRTPQGDPKYFLLVVQDVSARQTAESALQPEEPWREKSRREALLNRLSTQIRNSLDVDTILETTVLEIRQLLRIDRCQFIRYHTEQTPAYWKVVTEDRESQLPDLTDCYWADTNTVLTQQILHLDIVRIDTVETVSDPLLQEFMRSLDYQSLLLIPLETPSGITGIISCSHTQQTRPWTDSEVELLQAVISQLLMALQQAELYAASCRATEHARKQAAQLSKTLHDLQRTQSQLIQSEKMSSLGQLVAGIAHEINNPVNFIYGNLIYAQEYYQDLIALVQLYRTAYPNPTAVIKERMDSIDLDFILTDFAKLQYSMKVGAERIREIVQSLRTFSRLDESGRKTIDIHSGIESALMILQYRLKEKPGAAGICVIKEYEKLPPVDCWPGQLNQVFMNILTNAIDAIEDKENCDSSQTEADFSKNTVLFSPTITIRTGLSQTDSAHPSITDGLTEEHSRGEMDNSEPDNPYICIRIADNGIGMSPQTKKRLFDPFFTTKPVGLGTGLGLAVSYQIVVEKHGGKLWCNSTPEQGAEFVVEIPIRQPPHKR
ncbi:MAG: PAS domain S-box protein [Coleofasciculus sp. A1-SPW-01]|uniref:PAS domain S-box protein n=1 Tax=Coleofasciculus sp. A1-SPW-01 TaxID=3070819 RepID=UPI0032F3C2DB